MKAIKILSVVFCLFFVQAIEITQIVVNGITYNNLGDIL